MSDQKADRSRMVHYVRKIKQHLSNINHSYQLQNIDVV